MSRNPHQPTEQTRSQVSALKSFGVNLDDISAYIGIDRKTLSKYYDEEIKTAQIKANAQVGKYLYTAASGNLVDDGATHSDCLRSAMFWAKTRMGWKESDIMEVGVTNQLAELLTQIDGQSTGLPSDSDS